MSVLAAGVWPVMLTPMTEQRTVDYESLRGLTDWYIDAGVDGLFAVSLSSEMYELSDDERRSVAREVVDHVDGRVPVVATGSFGDTTDEQAQFVRDLWDFGVDAVVVNVAEVAGRHEGSDALTRNLKALLDRTGEIPLGLYECPEPYHRLLTLDELREAAETRRFVFLKDTSCDPEILYDRLDAVAGTPLGLYNANIPTLLGSLRDGAEGYSGTAANLHPRLISWLCENYDRDPETAEALQQFLSVANHVVRYKYPASAKRYHALNEYDMEHYSRWNSRRFATEDDMTLRDLHERVEAWRRRLD